MPAPKQRAGHGQATRHSRCLWPSTRSERRLGRGRISANRYGQAARIVRGNVAGWSGRSSRDLMVLVPRARDCQRTRRHRAKRTARPAAGRASARSVGPLDETEPGDHQPDARAIAAGAVGAGVVRERRPTVGPDRGSDPSRSSRSAQGRPAPGGPSPTCRLGERQATPARPRSPRSVGWVGVGRQSAPGVPTGPDIADVADRDCGRATADPRPAARHRRDRGSAVYQPCRVPPAERHGCWLPFEVATWPALVERNAAQEDPGARASW